MSVRLQELRFSRGEQEVLGPLTTSIEGGLVGVVGPNGSGKSTLLRLLYGYLSPSSGAIFLDDKQLTEFPPRELASQLGVCPQEAESSLDFSVEQALALAVGGDLERVDSALEKLPFLNLSEHLTRRLSQLSGGEKQRVRLARALLCEPPWLLLDEPANHLDLRATWSLMAYLRQSRAGGVLVAMHDLALAVRFCHTLLLIQPRQQVIQGSVEEVLTPENLSRIFGVTGQVHCDGESRRLEIEGVS